MKKLSVLLVLMIATIASAEDDYTMKEWCRPFRPRVCYSMVESADYGERDGVRAGGKLCISAVDKAVDAHPECAEYLRGFRDRMLGDVGRTEDMWRSRDAFNAELMKVVAVERARAEGIREAKAYMDEVRKLLQGISVK